MRGATFYPHMNNNQQQGYFQASYGAPGAMPSQPPGWIRGLLHGRPGPTGGCDAKGSVFELAAPS